MIALMNFRVGLVKVKLRGNSQDELKSTGRGYFGYKRTTSTTAIYDFGYLEKKTTSDMDVVDGTQISTQNSDFFRWEFPHGLLRSCFTVEEI